ncbi:hypothetical protein V1264_016082 [Littorina saxatilis]|uniref:Uncharacterized protein n=1 Tax=Littorina saxatilis TaxID=31220 RepID=A0AAN9BNB2_9CAEN
MQVSSTAVPAMYGPRRERTPDMYGHICSARSVFLLYLPPLKRTPAKRGHGHSFSVPTAGHTSNVRTDHRQIFTTTKSITEQSGSWCKDHSRNGVTVTGNLSAPVPTFWSGVEYMRRCQHETALCSLFLSVGLTQQKPQSMKVLSERE